MTPTFRDWVARARAEHVNAILHQRNIELPGRGNRRAGPCPRCGGEDRFAIDLDKQVFNCRGCGGKGQGAISLVRFLDDVSFLQAVEEITGEPPPKDQPKSPAARGKRVGRGKFVCAYTYFDELDAEQYQVCRYAEPKGFSQRRLDPVHPGEWIGNLTGVRLVPYRLPHLIEGIANGHPVYWCEGEKDADNGAKLGLVTTTTAMGIAGKGHWNRGAYDEFFRGSDLVLVPDQDEDDRKGRELVRVIGKRLKSIAARVRMLNLPAKDLSEWIERGGTREAFDALPLDELVETSGHDDQRDALDKARSTDCSDLSENTEDKLGLAYAELHEPRLRFDHARGAWREWRVTHWCEEQTGLAVDLARDLCRERGKYVEKESERRKLDEWKTARAVEQMSRSDRRLACTADLWDRDPFLIAAPATTVELRTGRRREPRREDYITKLAAITPAADPDCPQWLRFLHEVTGGDVAMQRFLQQWCGYCLTADVSEQVLVFLYGPGGNGKTVFTNTLIGILADYVAVAALDTFSAGRGDRHPADLAMLHGARLVIASETQEGRAWDEVRIKRLTGTDPITARFMRQDFFTFLPTFKITVVGNYAPVLHNVGDAERRRFCIVPFVTKPERPDVLLEQKLRAEWPAIFAWMIAGCLDWQANGLIRPERVLQETATYFAAQDVLGQWISDQCVAEPGNANMWETSALLYANWKDYSERAGEIPESRKAFAENLKRRGFRPDRRNGERVFLGLHFKWNPPPQPMTDDGS